MFEQQKHQWIDKLNQFKKIQKSFVIHYTILKTLNEAIEQDEKIALQQIFQTLLKSLPKQIKHLPLYKQLIHLIWIHQSYPIKVRQQCSSEILKAVTQWIMQFEIKIDNVITVSDQFRLIRQYLQTNSKAIEITILIIDQIFQDLKDLFDQSFWALPQQNIDTYKQFTFVVEANPETPQQLISLLQLLIFRQIESVQTKKLQDKNKNGSTTNEENYDVKFYLSTYSSFATENYYSFILKCINFILCLELNQSFQSQITKLTLQFMRSIYCIKHHQQTINLFKRLMIRTKKSVRYALVAEYIQTYEFFQNLNCDQIIEQLEEIIYFRQLIIGQSKLEKNHQSRNLQENSPLQYFLEIFVKAGSKERVLFSVQDCSDAILKMQLILEEGMDINFKIFHLNNSSKQVLYHEQNKTELRKLDLKIKYSGLYAIEFDNSYSWIHGKKILYNLHIMKRIDNLQELLQSKKQFNSVEAQS